MVLREISAPNRKDIFREDKNLEAGCSSKAALHLVAREQVSFAKLSVQVGEECPILSDLHGRGLFRAEYISVPCRTDLKHFRKVWLMYGGHDFQFHTLHAFGKKRPRPNHCFCP